VGPYTGHVEERGKRGYTSMVIEGKPDPVTKKRDRWREKIPVPPGVYKLLKRDAEVVLHARLADLNRGVAPVKPSPLTLGELLDKWLDVRVKPRLAPATVENYEINTAHLKKALGDEFADRLQPMRLQKVYAEWLQSGWHPRTIEQAHQVLHIALGWAMRMELVQRNVCDLVEPPHPKPREMMALDPEGLDKLLEAMRHTPLYPMFAIAAYTGMRRGELLGLRWEDVDLKRGEIHVEQAFQRVDGKDIVKAPKTRKGKRDIPLVKQALTILRDLRKQNPHPLVFCKEDGTRYSPSYVTHKFSALAKKAGIDMRLHDERHTYITLLLLAGADIRVAQALAGHEDIGTTANYSHVLDAMKRKATASLQRTISPKKTRRHQIGTKSDAGDDGGEKD
jgi:integrase